MRTLYLLIVALVATWLTLSGFFKPMLLSLGAISITFVIWLCQRMKIIDDETAPYGFVPRSLLYFRWLFKEIVKANFQVVKAVLRPDLEVTPALIRVRTPQKTDIGLTVFANSITLTPGTVSIDLTDDEIIVHALLTEMSDPDDFEEMGERSAWAVSEDGSAGRLSKKIAG